MAFLLQDWSRSTSASNAGQTAGGQGGMAIFTFRSSTDAQTAIQMADYFAEVVYELTVGDLIFARGSDGVKLLEIAALDRVAGTVTTAVVVL